jgi:hypothetical protein
LEPCLQYHIVSRRIQIQQKFQLNTVSISSEDLFLDIIAHTTAETHHQEIR